MVTNYLKLFTYIIIVFGCTKKETSQITTIVPGKPEQRVQLGGGYNSFTGEFLATGPCLKGSLDRIKLLPSSRANLDGGYSESFQSVTDKLQVGGSVKQSVGGLGNLKASISIANSLADSDLKTSYYTMFSYEVGTATLNKPTITQLGQVSQGLDAVDRLITCGDELVYQIDYGARIHIGLEFSFHSKEMKQTFAYRVQVKDKITGSKILDFHDSESTSLAKLVADVKVIFIQEGGDNRRYQQITNELSSGCFVNGSQAQQIKREGFGAKEQTLGEEFEPCLADYRQLTTYAFEEFSEQIEQAKLSDDLSGLVPLRIHTRPYINFGYPEFNQLELSIPAKVRPFSQKLTAMKDDFVRLYSGNLSYKNILANTQQAYISALEKAHQEAKDQASRNNQEFCDVYKEFDDATPLLERVSLLVNQNDRVLTDVETVVHSCETRIYEAIIESKRSNQNNNDLGLILAECSTRLFGSERAKGLNHDINQRLSAMCLGQNN